MSEYYPFFRGTIFSSCCCRLHNLILIYRYFNYNCFNYNDFRYTNAYNANDYLLIRCRIAHNNEIFIILTRDFSKEQYVLLEDDMPYAIETCRSILGVLF